jgi:hypothetical protein
MKPLDEAKDRAGGNRNAVQLLFIANVRVGVKQAQ